MYNANSAARRLTTILGLKPSRKPLVRLYLQEAYASALDDANNAMNIADSVQSDSAIYDEICNKINTVSSPTDELGQEKCNKEERIGN